MKLKPLLLTIPFILILGILYCLEIPAREESNEPTLEESESVFVEEERGTSVQNIDYTTLCIGIGKVGSLQGGGEPIYEEPDETSKQVAELQYNCAVLLEEEQMEEDWVYVDLIGKGTGYVRKEAVDIQKIQVGDADETRDTIVKNAIQYLGMRFKVGGSLAEEALDCSNFVSEIYALSNLTVPNKPLGLRDFGTQIEEADAKPGDVVFYDKANDGGGHVGLYLTNGLIIHSSGHSGRKYPEGGVRISCLQYADRDSYQIYDILDNL